MVDPINIAGRLIGSSQPCFVIAEAGVNHNGSLDMGRQLIDAAVEAGADAVKFQTFRAMDLVTRDAPMAEYQQRNTGKSEAQYEMLRKLELDEPAHQKLIGYCQERGILFLSTPFDQKSADLLLQLNVSAFKVSSGDLTNHPLLDHLAASGLPVILSTGMATMEEVQDAVNIMRDASNPPVAILQCVSNYPADVRDVNLRAMNTMAAETGCLTGYSDHTLGDEVALAAVALGARILEKHLTLDTTLPGPDHAASMNPADFALMIRRLRNIEAAMGSGLKMPVMAEENTRFVARKSLFAAIDISPGEVVAAHHFICRRPGSGLSPNKLATLIGRRFIEPVKAGELIRPESIQ